MGFLVGAVCAWAEALSTSYPVPERDETTVPIPSPDQDLPPELGDYGLVLVPPGSLTDFPDAEQAREVRPWAGSADEKVLDREAQVWWASIPGHRGYDGRWGAMCQRDPCDARSGMAQPDFRTVLLEELALYLSE